MTPDEDDDLGPEPPAQTRIEAVVEDCEFLAATGESLTRAAERLGYANRKTLERVLWRAHRGDLIARLKEPELDAIRAEQFERQRRRHDLAA